MSLSVQAYRRNPVTNERVYLAPTPPCNDVAGFEAYRRTVYGCMTARQLGLTLLPSLGEGVDISAEGEDLAQLRREVDLLLANLPAIAVDAAAPASRVILGLVVVDAPGEDGGAPLPRNVEAEAAIRFRLENILNAIQLAQQQTDGIGGVFLG